MAVAQEKDVAVVEEPRRRGWWRWFGRRGESAKVETQKGKPAEGISKSEIGEREMAGGEGAGWGVKPKVGVDVADLFIMSRIDNKAPAEAPGSGDLLDAMVKDHLQRAVAPGGNDGAAGAMTENERVEEDFYSEPAGGAAKVEGASAEERAANLQREIEALLSGDVNAAAPVEKGSLEVQNSDLEIQNENTGGATAAGDLSQAELDVLLKGGETDLARAIEAAGKLEMGEEVAASIEMEVTEAIAPVASEPVAAAVDSAMIGGGASDEAGDKILEAEGVLAAELAQLMAETQASEPPAAMGVADWSTVGETDVAGPGGVVVGAAVPEKNDADLTAEVQSIMKGREAAEEAGSKKQEASSEEGKGAEVAAPKLAAVMERAVAPAGAPEHPVIELELPPGIVRRPGFLMRMWGIVRDVLMVILQAVDLPFGWMKEPDKNVIGVAALCLLLGGVVLFGWACWLKMHGG